MCHMQERGALVFEPRRFVELRKKPFWQQFMSAESTGMGIFYTLNVFCIQVQLSLPQLGVPPRTKFLVARVHWQGHLLHPQYLLHSGMSCCARSSTCQMNQKCTFLPLCVGHQLPPTAHASSISCMNCRRTMQRST